jgi:type I site-specific restriction-modification system R (restriction) subunit
LRATKSSAERDFQDYQSLYLNLYAEFRSASDAEKESINDDVVFEIELIKQVEINVDYILMLVEQYLQEEGARATTRRSAPPSSARSMPARRCATRRT